MAASKLRLALVAGGSFALGYLACLLVENRSDRDDDERWVKLDQVLCPLSSDPMELYQVGYSPRSKGSCKRVQADVNGSHDGETVYARPEDDDHVKMVVAVRKDLKMKEGKIGAQVGHAAVDCVQEALSNAPDLLDNWEESGSTKVCLKIDGEDALLALEEQCRKAGLITALIEDEGRTQVAEGSRTVCGVLGPAAVINANCGHLKLL